MRPQRITVARYCWRPPSSGTLRRLVAAHDRVAIDGGNAVGDDLGPSTGFGVVALNGAYGFGDAMRRTAGLFGRRHTGHLHLAGDAAFGHPADPIRMGEPGRMPLTRFNLTF